MLKRTEDEVVLRDLSVPDLLVERLRAVIDIGPESELGQLVGDVCRVLLLRRMDEYVARMEDWDGECLHMERRRGRRGLGAVRARMAFKKKKKE